MNEQHTERFAALQRELKRVAAFGAVGILNGLINYAIFMAIIRLVLTPAGLAETPWAIGLANACAWAIAVSNSYIFNAKFTFRSLSGGQLSWRNYASFASAGLFGMVAETASLLIADIYLELWLAKLISIGVAFFVNFTVTRLFVFKA